MHGTKVNIQKIEVKKSRKNRPINMAASMIPFDRDDVIAVNAIFHKSFMGHVLIAVNKSNRPVVAWCDVNGIVPIKSRLVTNRDQFVEILKRLQPKTLYLNNGEVIASALHQYTLSVYNNETLLDILNRIEVQPQQSTYGTFKLAHRHSDTKDLTFAEMKALDATLTRREYNNIVNMMAQQNTRGNSTKRIK